MVQQERLVGRENELGALRAWLRAARSGNGSVILIAAPAGMGKTRLVEELTSSEAGIPVGWGEAMDDTGMPPLWQWTRALRTFDGPRDALAAAVRRDATGLSATEAAAGEFAAHTAVIDAIESFASGTDGLLLVLEDVHWADDASLRLLDRLAAAIRRMPVLVVATHRGTATGGLAHALPGLLARPGTEIVRLDGLPSEHARALVGQTVAEFEPTAVDAIAVQAGGIPLYLRTIARLAPDLFRTPGTAVDGLAQLPELRDLITDALRRTGTDATAAVQTLSVLGAEADLTVLTETVGYDSPAELLDRLIQAERVGLVRVVGLDRVRMSHALMRDAIYAALDPRQRQAIHRRAAEVLEARAHSGAEDLAAEIAHHWQRAGEAETSAQWEVKAAAIASHAGAFADAASHLERAVAAGPRSVQLMLDHARAAYLAGDLVASIEACQRAARAGLSTGDHASLARAAVIVQGVADPRIIDDVEQLCLLALSALDSHDPTGEPALRAQVRAQLATVARERGDLATATRWADGALTEAQRSGDPMAELDALLARGPLTQAPHLTAERLVLGSQAIALATRMQRPMAELWGRCWLADAHLESVDVSASRGQLAALEGVANRTRIPLVRWHVLRRQAAWAALTGDYLRGLDLSLAANEVAGTMGDISAKGLHVGYVVWLAWLRGVEPEVPADVMDTFRHAPSLPVVQACRAVLALLEGRENEAHAGYRSLPLSSFDPENPIHLPMLAHAADLAVYFHDAAGCLRIGDLLAGLHAHTAVLGSGSVVYLGSVARARARLEAIAGQLDEAIALFEQGIEVDGELGARPYVTQGRIGLADALRRRGTAGDLPRARELATRALADAVALEMPRQASAARDVLGSVNVMISKTDPLTAREREIASLVAKALSNREIAVRLVVSERTVEGHVRNILAKAGVTSRTELVRQMLERP